MFKFILQLLAPFRAPIPPMSPLVDTGEEDNRHGDATRSAVAPRGKGIFVQTVEKATRLGTPQALASLAVDLDLDWVMLLVIWQHDDRDRIYTQVVDAARRLQDKGIKVWVWGWPHPDRMETFVRHMVNAKEMCDAEGIILNVEAPFYGKRRGKPRHAKAAESLMSQLRTAAGPDITIGLSSYGARFWHKSAFPWDELAAGSDFGMPQIYDAKHKFGPDYPERCVASWEEIFDVVLPTLAASKRFTPDQMREKLNQTPLSHAVSWWDCNHIRYSRARQAVIREYEVQA